MTHREHFIELVNKYNTLHDEECELLLQARNKGSEQKELLKCILDVFEDIKTKDPELYGSMEIQGKNEFIAKVVDGGNLIEIKRCDCYKEDIKCQIRFDIKRLVL